MERFVPENKIIGAEQIVEIYGTWPSFHDYEITRIILDRAFPGDARGPHITVYIHMWKYLGSSENCQINYGKHNVVGFCFSNVFEHNMSNFNIQNVIDDLEYWTFKDKDQKELLMIVFPSLYGVDLKIKCCSIEIVSIEPGIPPFSVYGEKA